MAIIKGFKDELVILFGIVVAIAFIYINVDKDIGSTYIALGLGIIVAIMYFVATGEDPYYSQRLLKENSPILYSVFYFLAGYTVFVVASNFILKSFSVTNQSTFDLLQASAPVLSNVPWIQFITFGILIPFIETFLFFVLTYDILLKSTNQRTPVSLTNFNSFIMVAVISLIFITFHFTAKLGTPNALYVTGVFSVISLLLIIYRRQWVEALALHVAINSYTMYLLLYA